MTSSCGDIHSCHKFETLQAVQASPHTLFTLTARLCAGQLMLHLCTVTSWPGLCSRTIAAAANACSQDAGPLSYMLPGVNTNGLWTKQNIPVKFGLGNNCGCSTASQDVSKPCWFGEGQLPDSGEACALGA